MHTQPFFRMFSVINSFLSASLLFAAISAVPFQSPNAPGITVQTLSRRADPNTTGGFKHDDTDQLRVKEAFKDVIELCSYVITAKLTGIDSNSPFFKKYFQCQGIDQLFQSRGVTNA